MNNYNNSFDQLFPIALFFKLQKAPKGVIFKAFSELHPFTTGNLALNSIEMSVNPWISQGKWQEHMESRGWRTIDVQVCDSFSRIPLVIIVAMKRTYEKL